MNTIYIIHYHLHPGGVTRIIESQVQSLRAEKPSCNIVLLTGDDAEISSLKLMNVEITRFSLLNYLAKDATVNQHKEMFGLIYEFLSSRIQPGDIVHAHNINLGKNPLLTLALFQLAKKGIAVVNHCHDFAEDRPENWRFLKEIIERNFGQTLQQTLYPDYKNVSFLVLNSVDKKRLLRYNVNAKKIFHLPNPINIPSTEIEKSAAQDIVRKALGLENEKLLVTYPVRVIRRKNVGEFILLAYLFRDRANWMITQPPRNPVEIEPYIKWKQFCAKQHIDVHFEVGEFLDFETLMFASDFCITTSVQEGFGMAFMEPWSFGVPVIGRDIPGVTADLKEFGMQLPALYEKLTVIQKNEERDFAQLSMENQMSLVLRVIADENEIKSIMQANPFLNALLRKTPDDLVGENQLILREKFSISAYGQILFTIYDSVAQRFGYPGADSNRRNAELSSR
jgi:glycosyltransferase involved in cell wall biosynthesis